jgi:hypothetical protein
MTHIARVFQSEHRQAIRPPVEFRCAEKEVYNNFELRKLNITKLTFCMIFLQVFFALACPIAQATSYRKVAFNGTVSAGQSFSKAFDHMVFKISPSSFGERSSEGFVIEVEDSSHKPLSWINFPLTGGYNDLDILGADFRNKDNSGPNLGTVNRPQLVRRFYFSKHANTGQLGQASHTKDEGSYKLITQAQKDGIGDFQIKQLKLSNLGKGKTPRIERFSFHVTLKYLP